MDTYSVLRQIADSWVLLGMFGFFIGAIFWAFRPGSSAVYEDVGQIPLRNDAALPTGSCAKCTGEGGGNCKAAKGLDK